MFHWTDGFYFGRRADGDVRVLKFERSPAEWPKADAPTYPDATIDKVIPAAEWASITSSVSKSGESTNYQAAVDLHDR